MELRLDIGLDEIMQLIRQLPLQKQQIIIKEIEKEIISPGIQDIDFTSFLLNGPVMSKGEYLRYRSSQQDYDIWTKSLFA